MGGGIETITIKNKKQSCEIVLPDTDLHEEKIPNIAFGEKISDLEITPRNRTNNQILVGRDNATTYKKGNPRILGDLDTPVYCGYSMFAPCDSENELILEIVTEKGGKQIAQITQNFNAGMSYELTIVFSEDEVNTSGHITDWENGENPEEIKFPKLDKGYIFNIINESCVWKTEKHSAFTNMVVWNNEIYLSFREGDNHAPKSESEYGAIRILKYNHNKWEEFIYIKKDQCDLRDPFLTVTPDNKLLLLCGYNQLVDGKLQHAGTLHSTYTNGKFSELQPIIHDVNHIVWLWKVRWANNWAYGVGYLEHEKPVLLISKDGVNWKTKKIFDISGVPTEADLCFFSDSLYIFLRRDCDTAYLGKSKYPYEEYAWVDTGKKIESPELFYHKLSKKILLCGRHHYKDSINVELFEIEPSSNIKSLKIFDTGRLGDKGYPSIISNGKNNFLVSYYWGSFTNNIPFSIELSKGCFIH